MTIINNIKIICFIIYDFNLNNAFSAPKIWTVDAGYLAKLVRLPAWEMSLAPTFIKLNIQRRLYLSNFLCYTKYKNSIYFLLPVHQLKLIN